MVCDVLVSWQCGHLLRSPFRDKVTISSQDIVHLHTCNAPPDCRLLGLGLWCDAVRSESDMTPCSNNVSRYRCIISQ